MLSRLSGPLLGAFMATLLVANTVFWATPLYVGVLIKLMMPVGTPLRRKVSLFVASMAQRWSVWNVRFAAWFLRVDWDIRINADVNRNGQYLVCSNHQTFNDIFVLMTAFGDRAPFFKFFIKQELIWVPVLGLAWWGLDYPFMKRYTPSQIKKNPALKGKDLETTKKACAKFRDEPSLVLNFLEGTRFTVAKRDRQNSPYRHLLRPKAGGFAFALSALGDKLDSLLDVTIVYPDGAKGMWDFLCGRVPRVIFEVRPLQVPHEFYNGTYETDPAMRKRFQLWLGELWTEKDKRIGELLAEAGVSPR